MTIIYRKLVAAVAVLASVLSSAAIVEGKTQTVKTGQTRVAVVPQITGNKCAKDGVFRTVKTVKYQCTKSAKGLRWAIASQKGVTTTTTVTSACALGDVCKVGDIGPGGGVVFYVHPGGATFSSPGSDCASNCKYLEVANHLGAIKIPSVPSVVSVIGCYASASSSTTHFDTLEPNKNCAGPSSLYRPGSICTEPLVVHCQPLGQYGRDPVQENAYELAKKFGMGRSNTLLIISLLTNIGGSPLINYAAGQASLFKGNGKTDWHLPSKDELNELCKFARETGQDPGPQIQCQGGIDPSPLKFKISAYLTSSQMNDIGFWVQRFNNGESTGATRTTPGYPIRPVRAF